MSNSQLAVPEDGWKLKANASYQDVMKTLMSLSTASLVLPLFFMRSFGVLPEGKIGPCLRTHCPAYWAWFFLFLSLVCGMLFYVASAKFVKAVCGGYEKTKKVLGFKPESFFENLRDLSGGGAGLSFLGGLYFAWRFFEQL
jgi:hypothetical protein